MAKSSSACWGFGFKCSVRAFDITSSVEDSISRFATELHHRSTVGGHAASHFTAAEVSWVSLACPKQVVGRTVTRDRVAESRGVLGLMVYRMARDIGDKKKNQCQLHRQTTNQLIIFTDLDDLRSWFD